MFKTALRRSGGPLSAISACRTSVRSAKGPLAQLPKYNVRNYADAKASPTEVSSILEQRISGVREEAALAETGRVLSVGYVKSNLKTRGSLANWLSQQ